MSLQVRSLVKALIADGTLVWRFFHVQNLVDSQCSGLAESFSALGAFERLFLGMNVSVNKKRIAIKILIPSLILS